MAYAGSVSKGFADELARASTEFRARADRERRPRRG